MGNLLASVLETGAIRAGYSTDDFESAVRGLLEGPLRNRGVDGDRIGDIVEAVLRREEAGATSAGVIAFPHARVPGIPGIVAGLGVNRGGVYRDAETRVMVAFVSPTEAPGEHLRFLSAAAKTFRDGAFLQRVLDAGTGDELLALFAGDATAGESPSR